MNDNASIQRPHPDQVAHALPTPEGEVALQRAGTGPTVLLRGWEGRASDFAAFTSPLFEAGQPELFADIISRNVHAGLAAEPPVYLGVDA